MPTYGAGNKQRQALQLDEFEEIIKGAGTSLNCKFNIFQYVLCLTSKEMEPMTKPIRITNIIDPDSSVLMVIPTGTTVILHHAKERKRVNPKMHELRAVLTNNARFTMEIFNTKYEKNNNSHVAEILLFAYNPLLKLQSNDAEMQLIRNIKNKAFNSNDSTTTKAETGTMGNLAGIYNAAMQQTRRGRQQNQFSAIGYNYNQQNANTSNYNKPRTAEYVQHQTTAKNTLHIKLYKNTQSLQITNLTTNTNNNYYHDPTATTITITRIYFIFQNVSRPLMVANRINTIVMIWYNNTNKKNKKKQRNIRKKNNHHHYIHIPNIENKKKKINIKQNTKKESASSLYHLLQQSTNASLSNTHLTIHWIIRMLSYKRPKTAQYNYFMMMKLSNHHKKRLIIFIVGVKG